MKLCFVHIPKAGGTSVTQALRKMFGADAILRAGSSPETRALRKSLVSFDGYSVVSAHMRASDLNKLFPEAALYTLVRDPVARAVSIYKHLSTVDQHPLFEANSKLSFKEHLRWMHQNEKGAVFNQAYYVDAPHIKIFRLEQIDEFFDAISHQFGVQRIKIPHANAIEKPVEIDDEAIGLIRTLYAPDFALYESALGRTAAGAPAPVGRP